VFWVLVGGLGVLALVSTALTFHQVDVLGERGLTPAQAAATFLPQTVAGLLATLLVGLALDRISPRPVMIGSMMTLAAALVAGGYLEPGWGALTYGVALGVAGNSFRPVEAAALPRYFGTHSIGEVRGIVHTVTVAASAVGPLLLALGHAWSHSYRPILLGLTAFPLALILAAVLVPEPATAPGPDPSEVSGTA
jgi:MFS family permease